MAVHSSSTPAPTRRPPHTIIVDRSKVVAAIERLIAVLDDLDGDPELEPSLGSLADVFGGPYGCTTLPHLAWGASDTSDREQDAGDQCEAIDEDGDAPETHGRGFTPEAASAQAVEELAA